MIEFLSPDSDWVSCLFMHACCPLRPLSLQGLVCRMFGGAAVIGSITSVASLRLIGVRTFAFESN